MSDFATLITTVFAAGGSGALVAYAVIKRFADAWLDSKFSEKMEAFRHEKAKELEKLRAEIEGALKAKVRHQEIQFESIVAIWDVMKLAQRKIANCVSPLQSYSDIRQMDDEARAEYIDTFPLQSWQKKEILASSDPQKSFSSMVDRKNFSEAAQAFDDFDKIHRAKEIFFTSEISTSLRLISDKMHSALVSKQFSLEGRDIESGHEAWKIFDKECNPLISDFVLLSRKIVGTE